MIEIEMKMMKITRRFGDVGKLSIYYQVFLKHQLHCLFLQTKNNGFSIPIINRERTHIPKFVLVILMIKKDNVRKAAWAGSSESCCWRHGW